MDLNQKMFYPLKDYEEINEKIYKLIKDTSEKRMKEKAKYTRMDLPRGTGNKELTLYFAYLFGLRISEALMVLENLYIHLSKKKTNDGQIYYVLHAPNLKQKGNAPKEKIIFLFPQNEYEKKMWDFIEKNYYNGSTKVLKRNNISMFCKKLKTTFIGYEKVKENGKIVLKEVIKESHLNPHSLRHMRAYVLFQRYGDIELVRKMLGWKDERMLYYYVALSKSIEEMELEKRFLQHIPKKEKKKEKDKQNILEQ